MRVHYKDPYSFILLEDMDHGGWYLTYFTGGAVEIDICVKLNNDEIKQALISKEETRRIVDFFKSNHKLALDRRVVPSKRP